MIEQNLGEAWMDLFDARYWAAYEKALGLLGLKPEEVKTTRALDLMPKVITACQDHSPRDYIRILELLIESGRGVGRELDALRIAWACIGVSELDWAPLELMVKLGEPTLSTIGRQGNANSVDNGTLSSISGTHLIAKQLGVARSILLGEQHEEKPSGLWGHLSKLSASFRTYPIQVENLQPADKIWLQSILLGGLQRAAYHIRSLLTFRAVFHPAFTSTEDGISSLTDWNHDYFFRFRDCWSHHDGYENLFWIAFGHAVSNLKQRWEGFALAAAKELSGVDVQDESFPEKILSQVSVAKKKHLFVDRCEKVVRLLNWIGKPAAARKLVELIQEKLVEGKDFNRPSLHTLFRAVSQFSRMNSVSAELRDAFRNRLHELAKENTTSQFANLLNARGLAKHGALFVVQALLICGKDEAVGAKERSALAQSIERHLYQLSTCWNPDEGKNGPKNDLVDVSPEPRFELRFWSELANVYRKLDKSKARSAAEHVVSFNSSESEIEDRVRLLQLNCAEDEDIAMAPVDLYAHADTLVQIADGPKDAMFTKHLVQSVSGGEVPLQQGEKGSLQSEKIAALKRLLPPAQFVKYMDFCVRGWGRVESEYRALCTTVVHEVIEIAYNDICPGADRREFIRSIKNLRNTIVNTTLEIYGPTSLTIPPQLFIEWLELLDHRLLIEEYLSNKKDGRNDTPPARLGDWGARKGWLHPSSLSKEDIWRNLDVYHNGWRKIARAGLQSNETPVLAPADCVSTTLGESKSADRSAIHENNIRSIDDVPGEFRNVTGFRDRLAAHLTEKSLWIKAIIDHKERATWWAFRRDQHSTELVCVASGSSKKPFANRRIELESLILDAKIDIAYRMATDNPAQSSWQSDWEQADPSQFFRKQLPSIFDEHSPEVRAQLEKRALEFTSQTEGTQHLQDNRQMPWEKLFRNIKGLLNVKKLAYELLQTVTANDRGSAGRVVSGWRELVALIDGDIGQNGEHLDRVLNRVCATHLEAVLADFTLESLAPELNKETDVVLTLDGPLSTIPVEAIPIKGRPLCELVNSVSALLSTSLATSSVRPHERTNPKKQLFAAVWEKVENRIPRPYVDGFDFFQAYLHRVCETSPRKESTWDCISVSDDPRATPDTVRSTLASISFPIVAFGSHGQVLRKEGSSTALCLASTRTKEGVFVDEYECFSGRGDLRGSEAAIYFACLIARLLDDGDAGIRGVFTENILAGGRVFCGARWSVHTYYAPMLCIEIIKELMDSIDSPVERNYQGPFRVARIVNRVRCRMMREMPGAMHTLSAFTCFGLSSPNYFGS